MARKAAKAVVSGPADDGDDGGVAVKEDSDTEWVARSLSEEVEAEGRRQPAAGGGG